MWTSPVFIAATPQSFGSICALLGKTSTGDDHALVKNDDTRRLLGNGSLSPDSQIRTGATPWTNERAFDVVVTISIVVCANVGDQLALPVSTVDARKTS